VKIASPADFAAYRGKLKGRIVLYQPPRKTTPHYAANATRHSREDLEKLASYPIPDTDPASTNYVRGFLNDLEDFFRAEHVGVLVQPSSSGRGDYGAVVASGIRSARIPSRPRPLPEIILAAEHYNRLVRIIDEYREPATMEVTVRTEFYDKDRRGYNVVAEIPGTDRKDEVVMLGGHIDSWSPGTGAADNAAGVAVSMEAVIILKALGVKPRRTIRVVLWSAEEKGWVGSKTYVANHFADVETMALKPEHAKVSAYFNYEHAGPPHEPGCLRPPGGRGSDPVGSDHREFRVSRGHARRDVAAQAAAGALEVPRQEIGRIGPATAARRRCAGRSRPGRRLRPSLSSPSRCRRPCRPGRRCP
jgi:hypothetical protein